MFNPIKKTKFKKKEKREQKNNFKDQEKKTFNQHNPENLCFSIHFLLYYLFVFSNFSDLASFMFFCFKEKGMRGEGLINLLEFLTKQDNLQLVVQ